MLHMDRRKRQHPEAIALYQAGLSIAEVARFYGVTRQAMWGWLQARGVRMRSNLRHGTQNHFYRMGTRADDQAQNLLETAVKKGLITRKIICEKCGATPTFRDGRTGIQAHHCDYNKPLDVMWLCQSCHHDWHKNNTPIRKQI
jgi:hypothetical protein